MVVEQWLEFDIKRDIGHRLISIETMKLASSQHRFYFDVHKECDNVGNLDWVKLHWVGGN